MLAHPKESTSTKAIKNKSGIKLPVFQRLTVLIPWSGEFEPSRKANLKLGFQKPKVDKHINLIRNGQVIHKDS